jgi:creatinine amidohydrolase/Fe(II)-dependent formamide hydrolase-like protein
VTEKGEKQMEGHIFDDTHADYDNTEKILEAIEGVPMETIEEYPEEPEETRFEILFRQFVNEAVEAQAAEMRKEDAKEIVKAVVGELDEVVAKHIRKHIRILAEYLLQHMKDE